MLQLFALRASQECAALTTGTPREVQQQYTTRAALGNDSWRHLNVAVPRNRSLSSRRVRSRSRSKNEKHGGSISLNSTHVVKRLRSGGGLNYYLEKMALCRLERSSSPCAGRRQYFPQLLGWDDATLELFMTNAGQPLAGAHGENKRHLPWSQYSVQFSCMQRQLALVNVVHHDLMAKQVLAKRDSRGAMQLTLADFDESSVDELSCPCTGSVHLTLTLTLTPTFALTLLTL